MSEHEKLLAQIERFLSRTGMSDTKFGMQAASQRSLLWRLRRGEGVSLLTAEKVRIFMRNYSAKKKPSSSRLDHRVPA